ncbi:MAG: ribbon-helix-helix domain-containing protein [Enhydrobacter sp.]|nr:MAG: ribbon-helix-helix domain-containing protein [Enhydrobacter sp.]
MRKRSVVIGGHATSISLEDEFWDELTAIARGRDLSLAGLIQQIDRERGDRSNLSSALRLYVLETLRQRVSRD